MSVLTGIALKSLLIAGLTLGLLQLMKSRSAAERSWVAHIGLFALVIMAFLLMVGSGMRIASRADHAFDKLLAVGLSTLLGVQAFIIIGGVVLIRGGGGVARGADAVPVEREEP